MTPPDRIQRLALKLADQYAMIAFNSNCYPGGEGWHEIPPANERDGHLNEVLRYLRARKMLERSADNTDLWRAVNAPHPGHGK